MNPTPAKVDLSVIIPVTDVHDDLLQIHDLFEAECRQLGRSFEFLFVVHGEQSDLAGSLEALRTRPGVEVIHLAFTHDESAALNAGFKRARGDWLVTVPAYHSVRPAALGAMLREAEAGADCALAVRSRRRDPLFNRLQARLYSALVSAVAGRRLRDISTGARALRGEVARSMTLYGDQYRYLPVLLVARGYRVVEVEVEQSEHERGLRIFGPGTYLHRLVDLAAMFFLVRFTKRPLRFFGVLGAALGLAGLALCVFLAYQRLINGHPLANRPALLLGILLLVLGVQTGSLGLLGELVVHLQAQREFGAEADEVSQDLHSPAPPAAAVTSGSSRGSGVVP